MIYRVKPAANVATALNPELPHTLYISNLWVCNNSSTIDYFTICLLNPGEEIDTPDTEVYCLVEIAAHDTFLISPGLLESNQVIVVESTGGNCVFTLSGDAQ